MEENSNSSMMIDPAAIPTAIPQQPMHTWFSWVAFSTYNTIKTYCFPLETHRP